MEGTGSRVSQALVLQEGAQVGTVPVDGIGDHPVDGQAGSLGTLDHLLAQFGFGLEADRLRNMSGLPPGCVGAPVLRQIQFTVDEGMPLRRDVGEEDADLTILDASGESAILWSNACGVGAAFGEATFVHDKHGEGCLGLRTFRHQRERVEHLANQRTQCIAHAILVPGGS